MLSVGLETQLAGRAQLAAAAAARSSWGCGQALHLPEAGGGLSGTATMMPLRQPLRGCLGKHSPEAAGSAGTRQACRGQH